MEECIKKSLSIIVPALNEEKNILETIEVVHYGLVANNITDYEILIFDDGSTDKTGELAESAAAQDTRIKVVHHEIPQGVGKSYQEGIKLAIKEYLLMIPGDNETEREAVKDIIGLTGKSDVIVVYTENQSIRTRTRRIFSKTYTSINNLLFRLSLPYFNGTCLIKRDLLTKLDIKDTKFVYMTEILVKLIKRDKCDYIIAPVRVKPITRGSSKVFKFKNFVGVGKGILNLYKDIYFK